MGRVVEAKVTARGVLVPRPLIARWGDISAVEIEQQAESIVIKPKAKNSRQLRDQIVQEMKQAGLIEESPWAPPPPVPAKERERLAQRLSRGKPLSEIIIKDRADRA